MVFDGALGADVILDIDTSDRDAIDPTDAIAFDEQIATSRNEVAVIDTSINDYQTLAANIPHDIDIIYIDGTQGGLAQLETQLANYSDIDALHIFGHGAAGTIQLGSTTLDNTTLDGYASELAALGQKLTDAGDILFYNCDVAGSDDGIALIQEIGKLTQADIAASTDLTGAASVGGDWNLEYTTGRTLDTLSIHDDFENSLSTMNTELTVGTPATGFSFGGGAVAIAPNLELTDPDTFSLTTAKVTISNQQTGDVLALPSVSDGSYGNVTGSYNSSTGVLTLSDDGTSTITQWQTALRAVTFDTTGNNTTQREFEYVLGDAIGLTFGGNTHYYEYVADSGISWADAKTAAENSTLNGLTGYLATITNADENNLISQKLAGNAWLGASDADVEDTWKWVTGPEAGTVFWNGDGSGSAVSGQYENWKTNEPNDTGSDEDYAHMYADDGTWNDFNETNTVAGYVIEYNTTGTPTFSGTASLAVSSAPVIVTSGSSITVTEDGTFSVVDASVDVLGGGDNFSDGYLKFEVTTGGDTGDFLEIASVTAGTENNAGVISESGGYVYIGQGGSKEILGTIDSVNNGQDGKPLQINFSSLLPNAGFEDDLDNDGVADGWTFSAEQYGVDTDDNASDAGELNLDGTSVNLATYGTNESGDSMYTGGTGTIEVVDSTNATFGVTIADGQGTGGSSALKITSRGNIEQDGQVPVGSGSQPDGYGSIHGGYATSSAFDVEAGASVSLDFKAVGNGDDYEVFGFLRKVDANGDFVDNTNFSTSTTSNNVLLFAQRGDDTGGYISISKSNLAAGRYVFQFVGGTYDASGGYAVGSELYVDNIRLISGTGVPTIDVDALAEAVTYRSESDRVADGETETKQISITTRNSTSEVSTAATVDVNVIGVNDGPSVGVNTGLTVNEGQSAAITKAMLEDGDVDDSGAGITYTVTTGPAKGTLYVDGNGNNTLDAGEELAVSGTFTQADIDNGDLQYLHDDSETTSDSFAFSLADGGENGSTAVTGTFAITVTPVNDAPTAQNATLSVSDSSTSGDIIGIITGQVSGVDQDDLSSVLTFKLVSGGSDTNSAVAGTYGSLTMGLNGTYEYVPDMTKLSAVSGSVTDTFTLKTFDDDGASDTSTFTVTLTGTKDTAVAYNEQAPAEKLFPNTKINTNIGGVGLNFAGGYMEIDPAALDQDATLGLVQSAAPNTASGAISVVGTSVYLGNGSTASVIGLVDGTKNGQDGKALRINFAVDFANGNFDASQVGTSVTQQGDTLVIDGWTIVNDRVIFGQDTIDGRSTPVDPTYPSQTISRNLYDAGTLSSQTYESYIDQDESDATNGDIATNSAENRSIRLYSTMWSTKGYEVIRGPYVHSNGSVALQAGDKVQFDWKAEGGGDAYDVFGYIVDVNDDSVKQVILNETGANARASTPWSSEVITVDKSGDYQFVFVSGTFDATGGRLLGAQLYIDNVIAEQATAGPAVSDASVEKLAQLVTYQHSSDLSAAQGVLDRNFTLTVSGTDSNDATKTYSTPQALKLQEINDAPTLQQPGVISLVDTDAVDTFTNKTGQLFGADVDDGAVVKYGIDGGTGTTTQAKTGAYGRLEVNAATGSYKFIPNADAINALSASTTETFDVYAIDDDGARTLRTLTIDIEAVNDVPLFGGAASTVTFAEDATAVQVDPTLIISDAEARSYDGGYIELSYAAGGSSDDILSLKNIESVTVSGSDVFYAGKKVGEIDAALDGTNGKALRINLNQDAYALETQSLGRAMTFENTSQDPSTTTRKMVFTVNDGGDGGNLVTRFNTKAATIEVESVNDLPVITFDGNSWITEKTSSNPNGTFALENVAITDVDSDQVTVTFTVKSDSTFGAYGTLTLRTDVVDGLTSADFSAATGNSGSIITLTASPDKINATLAATNGLTYQATVGVDFVDPGPDFLVVTANDGVGTNVDLTKQILVAPKVPNADSGNVFGDEDSIVAVDVSSFVTTVNMNSGAYVYGTGTAGDDDANTNGSITAFNGNLISSGATDDLNNDGINGNETIGFELKSGRDSTVKAGELRYADPGQYLAAAGNDAQFIFIPEPDFEGYTEFLYRYDETGAGSTKVALIRIFVSPVNDAPVVTVSDAAVDTVEDTKLTFGTGQKQNINFADVDATATSLMDLSLSAGQGKLNLASTKGLQVLEGANGSGNMVVRGTLADLKAAIDGLGYTPNADYVGADQIKVTLADRGDTGSGGAKSDSQTIDLTITAVNDAPKLADVIDFEYDHTGTKVFDQAVKSAKAQGTDVDAGDKIKYGVLNQGNFAASTTADIGQFKIDPDTGEYSFIPNDAALYALTETVTREFTIVVQDDANPSLSVQKTVSITVKGQPLSIASDLTADQLDQVMTYYKGSQDARLDISGLSNEQIAVVVKHLDKFDPRDLAFLFPAPAAAPAPVAAPVVGPAVADAFTPTTTSSGAQVSLGTTAASSGNIVQLGASSNAFTASIALADGSGGNGNLGNVPASVTASATAPLMVNRPAISIDVDNGRVINTTLPTDTFVSLTGDANFVLEAAQADGSPLPSWLNFDATTGTFTGQVPEGATGTIFVVVVARDADGNEASTTLTLDLDQFGTLTEGGEDGVPADDAPADTTEPTDQQPEAEQATDDQASIDWDMLETMFGQTSTGQNTTMPTLMNKPAGLRAQLATA